MAAELLVTTAIASVRVSGKTSQKILVDRELHGCVTAIASKHTPLILDTGAADHGAGYDEPAHDSQSTGYVVFKRSA